MPKIESRSDLTNMGIAHCVNGCDNIVWNVRAFFSVVMFTHQLNLPAIVYPSCVLDANESSNLSRAVSITRYEKKTNYIKFCAQFYYSSMRIIEKNIIYGSL